ncbi:MAG: hypothetical protein HKN07_15590 [Acidimicrobiia bacterium]|nr:VIT1/CCC1 transporter family protein [Acidimicrobiia bacterium]NNF65666.1 hypothetical protein [Acidimicrobiia bacterium]
MEALDQTTDGEAVPYRPHIGESRQYVRDIILGVNDGLVSMFLLVAGVVGGGLNTKQILLTGVAGALAGAISMAAGEYLATKSQEEVFDREMALEQEHLVYHRDREVAELREMFADMHIHEEDLDTVTAAFARSDDSLMAAMQALEFGVIDSERRSPIMAMVASGLLFLLGSAPSVLPFVFVTSPNTGLVIAAIFATIGLFIVGALKTIVTDKPIIKSGAENLVIALVGAALSYVVGSAFNAFVAS